MDYYQCTIEDLRQELQRRKFSTYGSHDQLSEGLRTDNEERGCEATTVTTDRSAAFVLPEVNQKWTEFGVSFPASQLVNQRIVHWVLNTFFPTLQLFFESGLSCTIDGSQLPSAKMGLDPKLRFRLTNCTHEEEGRVTSGTLPEGFVRSSDSLRILEATLAQRTSIAVRHIIPAGRMPSTAFQGMRIVHEVHTVVGLRLSGMEDMGYIWARAEVPPRTAEGRIWGDVRLAGMRKDIPAPLLGLPAGVPMSGRALKVVEKDSMIKLPTATLDHLDDRGRPWI